MSTRKKKESSKDEFGNQENLQAIVFAEDFDYNLKPTSQIYPSIMLPVINTPLFDYILKTLERSKVQEVFVYYSTHIEKMTAYLESVRLQKRSLTITSIINDGCRSLGDALRDLDTKNIIRGDFILWRGTAFTNANLKSLMDLHKAKKQKDKCAAMTMLFREVGNVKDSFFKNESSFVVYNSNSKKLLSHEKFLSKKKIDLEESEWFLNEQTNIRTDLLDTRIYLCSQSVLPLFADNFDFQTMDDFIHGVLIGEEFMDARIYTECLPKSSFALPIFSWKAYKTLCENILLRYSYPLVPDRMQDFNYMDRCTYAHRTSTFLPGLTLHSIICAKSVLGKNSHIDKSIIGSECSIGTNVRIINSIIMSNVYIEDDCEVIGSIILSNCTVQKSKKLKSCMLMPEVKCKEDYSDTFIEINNDGTLNCKKFKKSLKNHDFNFSAFFVDNDSDNDSDNDDEDDSDDADQSDDDASSVSSRSTCSQLDDMEELQDKQEIFLKEVIESLSRGYEEKIDCENLILEINSSRYAYNISIQQVSFNVIKAILKLPLICKPNAESNNQYKILIDMLKYFKPVITNYIKTESTQEDCLSAIENEACTNKTFILPCALKIVNILYDNDILSEEKILKWYEQDCCFDHENAYSSDDEKDNLNQQNKKFVLKELKDKLTPFIDWLKSAEEEDDEDD